MEERIYSDGYDSINAMLEGCNHKQLAYHLMEVDGIWSYMTSINRAVARINDCKNPEKKEFFKLAEYIAITNYTGRQDTLNYFCDMTGRSRPHPIDANEQLQSMRQVIERNGHAMKSACELLSRIEGCLNKPEQFPARQVAQFSKKTSLSEEF